MIEASENAAAAGERRDGEHGADEVRIILPGGEDAWVSPDAFNLISEKEFRDSERLRRIQVQRNLAAAVAALTLIVAGAVVASFMTRPVPPAMVETAAEAGDPAETAEGFVGEGAFASVTSPAPSSSPEVREIELTVEAWARAWSARDAEAVAEFYSPDFQVPDGMARATWDELRRERITNPELLAVTVGDLSIEHTGSSSAVARFLQIYDTPGYRAWVRKTLELRFESGRWLIASEAASLAEVGTHDSGGVEP